MRRDSVERDLEPFLEGFDGAGLAPERRFQMKDCLDGRATNMRQCRRRADLMQHGSYSALGLEESFPEAVGGRFGQVEASGSQCSGFVGQRDDAPEESPQAMCSKACVLQFVGRPDDEGMSAALVVFPAVVAEDPLAPKNFAVRPRVAVAVQFAVQDQGARASAVRTARESRIATKTREFAFGDVLLLHAHRIPRTKSRPRVLALAWRGSSEVRASYAPAG